MSNTGSGSFRGNDRNYSKNVKKKRSRRKGFNVKRTVIVAASVVVAIGAGYTIYSCLPFVKAGKAIAAGDKYKENQEYESAIDSYSQAIEIDSKSVTAYSNMAGAYLSIDDSESAKQVLYDGWQKTDNEALLENYHRVIMNDAVDAMNRQEADLSHISDLVTVLTEDPGNEDAIEILDAAYDRVFGESFSYSDYEKLVGDLVSAYEASPCESLKSVVIKYATPGMSSFTVTMDEASSYETLIERVESAVGADGSLSSMKDCLTDSKRVQDIFADIFVQLDVGNVDELREFVVSDDYLKLRDTFLNDLDTPQENTTYVPISREKMILNCSEGKWSYRFADFEENHDTKGVITLWANFFEDDGVQRNAISYEPASIEGNMYPHTKYTVTYLLSYTTSGRSTKVAKMNYRLETEITDENGEVDRTIVGDWGGSDEWTMDLDTIESRIKA
ncbi:MAG: tetratricopeptide repeat protein [Butyrivibrio sp.]|nr:tetratricopeptide repeat protein [Butyrivibrio sp.]